MPLPHPYTRKDAEAWVALQSSKDPAEYFAICDAAGPIGGIGLNTQRGDSRRSAELGYYLGKQFWGRGITTAAVKVVTTYGFETLGLIRIYARVRKSNGASSRVLEKAGYRREGILRQAGLTQGVPVDLLMYAMLREDWPGHCLSPYATRDDPLGISYCGPTASDPRAPYPEPAGAVLAISRSTTLSWRCAGVIGH